MSENQSINRRWMRQLGRNRCSPGFVVLATFVCWAFAVSASRSAIACNIPVFRYALERWQADQGELVVFHDGPLSERHQGLIERLQAQTVEQGGHANATVTRYQVGKLGELDDPSIELLLQSLQQQGDVPLPCAVLRTRVGGSRQVNVWHGPLDEIEKIGLFESPIRKELCRRLLAGHAVVWLVLQSSDAKRNEEVVERLQKELDRLSGAVQLPEGIGLPGSELHSEVPLLVRFSTLSIDPEDAKERVLVELLEGFYPDAVTQGDPLLVPVFGRGRALEVIPASEIDSQLTEGLTTFLAGACSCQVKEQNPGFDLLMATDWDTQLFGEDGVRPSAEGLGQRRGGRPQLLTIPPGRNR